MEEEILPLQTLKTTFARADELISRQYLTQVSKKDIIEFSGSDNRNIRLFQLDLLVLNPEENINDRLVSVFSSLLDAVSQVDLALIISSQGDDNVAFYLGVSAGEETGTAAKLLQSGFEGNFPGSVLKNLPRSEISASLESIHSGGDKDIACLTLLPAPRDEDKEQFVQGIEKFVETMRGRKYTAIVLASAIKKQLADYRKSGLEIMYSALSPYAEISFAFGENESHTLGASISRAASESLSKGTSRSVSDSVSISDTTTTGTSTSYRTDGLGDGWTFGRSESSSHTQGSSHSVSNTQSLTTSEGLTLSTSLSDSKTTGSSLTRTITVQNKTVQNVLTQLEHAIQRIDEAKSYGLWNCATYFIADDIQTAALAANAYKGLLSGRDSSDEDSHVNYWSTIFDGGDSTRNPKYILDYLLAFKHPRFLFSKSSEDIKDAACLINGNDLSLLMGLPRKTIPGVTVYSIAEFGRKVYENQMTPAVRNKQEKRTISIGNVFHMGHVENTSVNLNLDAFSSHCFIAGSTGSGKSNTTYGLLAQFLQHKIPFLVIEPAKGEYRQAFGGIPGIQIFTTNPHYNQLLRINPFRFQQSIHILEHLDRLIEIFNCCWEMTAAMPAILKSAIEQCYIAKGWDLANSISLSATPVYPTFRDLLAILPVVIAQSGYSAQAQSDYRGALVSRVASLANGIFGQVLCDESDLSDQTLFDGNTIIDLSRVGSMESKALLMGLLVIRLTEYRLATAQEANRQLRHITVLEEAHNLLKRSGPNSSKLETKAVEMICSSIAEMRTFGEGFIIVDQSPGAVDIAAIKNTNTKIIMKLPDKDDGETVGAAFGLNEYQIPEIPRLPTGVAIVMQSNWLSPVLTLIAKYSGMYERISPAVSEEDIIKIRSIFVRHLLDAFQGESDLSSHVDGISIELESLKVSQEKKAEYVSRYLEPLKSIRTWSQSAMGKYLLELLKCQDLIAYCVAGWSISPKNEDEQSERKLEMLKKHFKVLLPRYCIIPNNSYWQLAVLLIQGMELQSNAIGEKCRNIIEQLRLQQKQKSRRES